LLSRVMGKMLTGRRAKTRLTEEGRASMCANCGCGIPEDRHGDDRNILWSEIVASAEANSISAADAVKNIDEMAEKEGQKS
jgi:hypothetical protein